MKYAATASGCRSGWQQQVDDCAKQLEVLNGKGLICDEEMAYLAPVIAPPRRSIAERNSALDSDVCPSLQVGHPNGKADGFLALPALPLQG